MPRPFPLPVNVGNDICHVQRIFRMLTASPKGRAKGLVRRILTVQESQALPTNKIKKPLELFEEFLEKDKKRKEITDLFKKQNGILKITAQAWKDIDGTAFGSKKAKEQAVQESETSVGSETNPKENAVSQESQLNENGIQEKASHTVEATKVNEAVPVKEVKNNEEEISISLPMLKDLERIYNTESRHLQGSMRKVAKFIAGRFAAKEAAIKAHRSRRLTYHDIWIRTKEDIEGSSQAPEALIISEQGSWNDSQIVPMSISHDGDYATAVCLSYEGQSSGIEQSDAQRTERELNGGRRMRRVVGHSEKSMRISRTIFIGGISPQTSITDLEEAFSRYSKSVKAYLYQTESGVLLGTGAIVMETLEDAAKARAEMDKTTLQGNTIRCMPFLRTSYREFLQRVIKRDVVYLKPQEVVATEPEEPVEEEIQKELEPKPLEPEPLPQPSSPQYILVRELFRIQEEYQERRARGVFVGNVPLEATDDDLQKLFAHISDEVKGKIRRTSSGRHLESGHVSFPTAEDATKARETMSGAMLLGKAITCGPIALREMGPSKKEPKFGGV